MVNGWPIRQDGRLEGGRAGVQEWGVEERKRLPVTCRFTLLPSLWFSPFLFTLFFSLVDILLQTLLIYHVTGFDLSLDSDFFDL